MKAEITWYKKSLMCHLPKNVIKIEKRQFLVLRTGFLLFLAVISNIGDILNSFG